MNHTIHKNKLQVVKDLKLKNKIKRYLKYNVRQYLLTSGDYRALVIKEKINKFEFHKMNNFCSPQNTIKIVKKTSEWEEIFAAQLRDKDLESYIAVRK